ncbi:MAG: cupin domain-containing protein [Mariprofundaceae bacterium]|nr:cupin domain-containing protein [Mariprofundaceae bacterium]
MHEPIRAISVPCRKGATAYPAPYDRLISGRCKRKLGDAFGLTNFGVNLTTLEPGSISSIAHHHTKQDEFILILEGEAVLELDDVK